MAVPVQTPYIEYTANGTANSFALEFDCENQDHLIVLVDEVEPVVGAWSLSSGAVVFSIAPSAGSVIKITRKTPLVRAVNYQSYDNSFSYVALNKDLDRIWYALQDQGYKLGQYDFDYTYTVNTANQANTKSNQALQTANSALVNSENALTETQPILRGGTGATTAETARTNLDVHSKSEVVALIQTGGGDNVVGIAIGGTGATTAEIARTNLNVYSKEEVTTAIEEKIDFIPYLPLAYPKSTPPSGYLALMGQSISQSAYPILFALYGATLPDLRGQFLRGLDYGKGTDAGRTILSLQSDAIRNITGSIDSILFNGNLSSGSFSTTQKYSGAFGGNTYGSVRSIDFNASKVVPTADENRPKNIAFLYIVKAG